MRYSQSRLTAYGEGWSGDVTCDTDLLLTKIVPPQVAEEATSCYLGRTAAYELRVRSRSERDLPTLTLALKPTLGLLLLEKYLT